MVDRLTGQINLTALAPFTSFTSRTSNSSQTPWITSVSTEHIHYNWYCVLKVWPLSWAWIICPQKNLNFSQFFFIIPLPLEFLTASGPSECDVPPHLAQPCCVALRRALIWGLYPDWLKALLIGYLRLNTTSNSGQRYSSWHINR